MVTSPKTSESKQIRNFHKQLATVVDVAILEAGKITVLVGAEAWIEILEIAVIAEVDRGAGVEQVGEEHIGVEILGGLQ